MFPFKKPPSRAEVARETVVSAVSDALDSLTHHAHDWLESAHDKLEIAGEKLEHTGEFVSSKVENALEKSPLEKAKSVAGVAAASGVATVSGAAEKLGVLGAGAATGAALAGKSVADKVSGTLALVREPAAQDGPDVKRARKQAQAEINEMNKKAANYKRELEQELARDQKIFADEQDRLKKEHVQLQAELEDARSKAAEERAEFSRRQRKYDEKHDIVRVPVAPTDEIVGFDYDDDGNYDGDYEYRDADNCSSGGNTWLVLGGILLAGAAAAYYLFTSTDGKRKKAAIQDRVGQVAEGVREKVTQNSDATVETDVAKVAEAASGAFDRSNEKIADDTKTAGVTGTPKASDPVLSDRTVAKIEEVSEKVADGIAGAGAFLADKLEAAGAGAKSAAHSAAEKLDDVKGKASAKMDEVRKPVSAQAPNAVVVEVITDEKPKGQTTDEILTEVEETVRNIENSANEGKK